MTMTTADPRTLAPDAGAWLTNSRVYNLIWLGRWMERAESLARAVDAAALAAAESDADVRPALSAAAESGADVRPALSAAAESDADVRPALSAAAESGAPLRTALAAAAEAWGVPVPDGEPPLPAIRAALRASIERARDNAHQIAPLEFIQRVNVLLESVESEGDASAGDADESPQALRDFAAQTLDAVAEASGVIERTWFNRQGLTNEELMQRFAQ